MSNYMPLDAARARRNPPSVWDIPDHVRVGKAYRFTPSAFIGERAGELPGQKPIPRTVTGKITYINRAHRYFLVVYQLGGRELSECIKY